MSQQTLETPLENIRLFEKCYYPGFRNAWQILPEIQAYQLNRKLLKRYKKKGLERIGKSHREKISANQREIQEVYANFPYERMQGKAPFDPVFTFRNELIPMLGDLVHEIDKNPDVDLSEKIEALRLKVSSTSIEFLQQTRAAVLALREHKGYENYVIHAYVNGKPAILTDDYLFMGCKR